VYGPGDYRFKGADLGILVTKGRMQTADGPHRALSSVHHGHPDGIQERAAAESTYRDPYRVRQVGAPVRVEAVRDG
jgi:hypothetical protein